MVDAAVIKKTQDSLGKVIKKPPLTEKLLSKPPFRYLHDIISEVIKSTGFLEGLFEDHEKVSANVKDKDQKILFLQKAIDAVGLAIGAQLAARPSKIIAGQEADKTNEFLQYLGRCAAKGADNEVVKRVKKGEKPGKKSESGKDGNKTKERRSKDGDRKAKASKERDSSKSKERVGSKERSKERVSGSSKERGSKERPERSRRDRAKDDRKGKAQSKSSEKVAEKKDSSEERRKEKEKERAKEKEERRRRKEAEEEEKRRKQAEEAAAAEAAASSSAPAEPAPIAGEEPSTSMPQQEAAEGDEEAPLTNGFHEDDAPARIPRPSSAKGARRRPEPPNADAGEGKRTYAEAVVGATTGEPPVPIMAGKRRERPTSARPAPPRIKKREDEAAEDIAVREGSGRPPAGIIVDTANQQDDDDEMFVNEEPEETAAIKQPVIMGGGGGGGQHGGLVQKIIDSQKQYSGPEKQEDKGPIMSQAARQKERAMTKKEIDQLRSGIQTLASSAAPLGKVLDYLQEDLDSMQKELENWRSENKYHETAIKAEESHMEKTLEPLRDQLEDTEQQIVDMINKINTMKCNIHNNDQKIGQMLSTMSFSAS